MGLITPGPAVITAAFIGCLVGGPIGVLTATIAIFTPIQRPQAARIASSWLNPPANPHDTSGSPMTSVLAFTTGATVFSHAHIALTAAVTGVLALAAAAWRLPKGAWVDIVAVAMLSAASVYLWRASANMTQLNDDGLPGFSANDWAAPMLTYVFLGTYGQARSSVDPHRYGQARALAVVASLVVNVVTI